MTGVDNALDVSLIDSLPQAIKNQILSLLPQATARCAHALCRSSNTAFTGSHPPSIAEELRRRHGICIRDGFLPDAGACRAARAEAEELLGNASGAARMGGGGEQRWNDTSFRGDRACWLKYAGNPSALQAAVDALLMLQPELALCGFDVGGKASIQLSHYPGNNARYVRHTDRSGSAPARRVTAILYLNPDWDPASHGGQLCLYHTAPKWGKAAAGGTAGPEGYSSGEPAVVVAPLGNRLVAFESGVPHEVLPAHADRFALTVWFSAAPPPQPSQALPIQPEEAGVRSGAIFVSIAAFRDPETRWTVCDLFAKAARPDALRVGVVWQCDAEEDAALLHVPCDPSRRQQIREVRLDYREATGPCKARALAQRLWAGEEYCLQIDSHMRFSPGWDVQLVQWLRQAEASSASGRAVLSTYPPSYEGEGPAAAIPQDDRPVLLRASGFGPEGMLRLTGSRLARALDAPLPSLFWAAGLSFSRARLLQEVPYEDLPWLFFGEEQHMCRRLWCAGYDMHAPPLSIAFHMWSRRGRPALAACVPQDAAARERSQQQVLDGFRAGSSHARDGACNGAAAESHLRLLSEFQAHCGVDYIEQTISAVGACGVRGVAVDFAADKDGGPALQTADTAVA